MTERFFFKVTIASIATTFAFCLLSQTAFSQVSWPWRGPSGNGIALTDAAPPTDWSASKNIVWKTKVPGRGHSSPIVAADRIFLSTADDNAKTQSVIAFDLKSGDQLWDRQVHQGGFNPKIHKKNSHATPTIAVDGERVFVVFNNAGGVEVNAFDLDGEPLWHARAGEYKSTYPFGFAPSPIIYEDEVLVTFEGITEAAIVAFDRESGRETRRINRDKSSSYSTPVIAKVGGREMLLISGGKKVSGYDPESGTELWSVPTVWQVSCATLVWNDDMVFASGGYPAPQTVAIEASTGKLVWQNKIKSYEQSMLVHDGYLYTLSDKGVAYCWRAKDGEEMWKERLSGPVSVSPVLANGNIYMSDEMGTTYVIKPNPNAFELVAKNSLGDSTFASPAFVGDKIYMRIGTGKGGPLQEWLVCICDQ